ncbi:MAG: hypothetical protein EP330_23985 [Deltaproteobacteria bacterium]|nr:MAG: hypothetical protein EP330_23985 [Deltaproteobacteria bacterium]
MDTTATIDIAAPPQVVFDYVADFENNPHWQGGMESCRWTSPPPLAVGSTYEQRASFLGRTILTTFEVTAYEPGHSIRIESVVSTFPIQVTRTVEPLDGGGARVTAQVSGQPPWYLRLPGMATLMRRAIAADYTRLRQVLERHPTT